MIMSALLEQRALDPDLLPPDPDQRALDPNELALDPDQLKQRPLDPDQLQARLPDYVPASIKCSLVDAYITHAVPKVHIEREEDLSDDYDDYDDYQSDN